MTGLRVIELKDDTTGEVYWRAIGNGLPPRATPTGRDGIINMDTQEKPQ